MNTVSESELKDFVMNNAVERLNIIKKGDKKYQVVVNLTWKEGDYSLVTTRKALREWASLDRLVRHIQENYGSLNTINILLREQK